jgi:hypothetical protein
VSAFPAGGDSDVGAERSVSVRLQGFAWEAVEEESERMGVSVEELVAYATLYYLADVDSGRISRRIPGSPYPDADASP